MSSKDPQQAQLQQNQQTEATWIITAVDKSPKAFFDTFNLNKKQDAHNRYQRLIKDSALSANVKNDLIIRFNQWKRDEGPQFWLDRQSRVSAIKTASRLVKGSEPFAQQSIERVAASAATPKAAVALSVDDLLVPSEFSTRVSATRNTVPTDSTSSGQDETADQTVQNDDAGRAVSDTATVPPELEAEAATPSVDNTDKATDTLDIGDSERTELLGSIEQARHSVCDWKINDCCIACLFEKYQKACVLDFIGKEIRKSEIADFMAITGVFAPFLPTARMTEHFGRNMLEQLVQTIAFPEPTVDDAAVLKAVRLRINGENDQACEALRTLDRKLRIMFETLLEQLPLKQDRSVSEETFIVSYISPVLQGTLKADTRFALHFPNTMSEVQKHQGIKPDRPDIIIKARDSEVLYGEVTGLAQETSDWKNKWDLFRLTRFGKAYLEQGYEIAPLLQIVYTHGTFLRLTVKVRGVYLLQEVGSFVVPTTVPMIPALLGTLPTLFAAQEDLNRCLDDHNLLKRSWGYKDVQDAKKRLV